MAAIRGSNSSMERGILLVETDNITNQVWETFSYTFSVETQIQYLVFEADLSGSNDGFGNLIIDNILLNESDGIEPPESDDFKIPNVFTPNDDGINDFFVIQGLLPFSSLLIFDRTGKEVFRSEEYNNNWDGTDKDNNLLSEDTYWYILIMPGFNDKHKGFVYLKRE